MGVAACQVTFPPCLPWCANTGAGSRPADSLTKPAR
uniref:Uncharacterized protein n=1 Tax=Siphoviridae sp. ctvok7 TaxID=2827596 RepID=A0A8S5LLE5_9CAUD|nr:MAG TPA: hypothetical protein [Siphoviridae sp. ctvok7]